MPKGEPFSVKGTGLSYVSWPDGQEGSARLLHSFPRQKLFCELRLVYESS